MARLLAALLITAVSAASAGAQVDIRPAFAVATTKKSSGDASHFMRLQPGGRIVATKQPLRRLSRAHPGRRRDMRMVAAQLLTGRSIVS